MRDLEYAHARRPIAIAFASSGAMAAVKRRLDYLGIVVLGVTTAIGGGILRDILSGQTPVVLRKHIYACASIAGAVSYLLFMQTEDHNLSMFLSSSIVVLIRLLARKYNWNLPGAQ